MYIEQIDDELLMVIMREMTLYEALLVAMIEKATDPSTKEKLEEKKKEIIILNQLILKELSEFYKNVISESEDNANVYL